MEFSVEQRRQAVKQVIPVLTAKSAFAKGEQILEHAILIQCQLNAAVELLQKVYDEKGYSDVGDFLAALREERKP